MDAPAVLSAPEGLLEQLGLSKAGYRLNLVAYCKTTHEKANESQQKKKALVEARSTYWSVCRLALGRYLGRYVAIDCRWRIGRLSVVSEYCSPLFCWNSSHLLTHRGTGKHPEISIERTKRPQNPQKKSNLVTQNGHILRSLTSLSDSITGSLTFSEKKPSHYALPTHPTRSEKPHLTPPRSANLLETNAPSPTPN